MATSLLALLDDIATILDDVAILTKVAAKKTAGVLGDDLALNAQQVAGVQPERELPVVWAVAKGSAINKVILVPMALGINFLAPWAIVPLLMIGGAFLCYEGCEKLVHKFMHSKEEDHAHHVELVEAVADPTVDLVAVEKTKIDGAVRTDFILSAEIIVITLGTAAKEPFGIQVAVLTGISLIMTIGVYGLVAGIVKLDDGGLYLTQRTGENAWVKFQQGLGKYILLGAPYLMKTLSVVGTAAMFTVGGGIITHNIPVLETIIHDLTHDLNPFLESIASSLLNALFGIVVGLIVLGAVMLGTRVWQSIKPKGAQT